MNSVINKFIDNIGVSFQPKVIEEFNLTLDIQGLENLPDTSRCFFAANHPFGIIDGLILTYIVGQKYGDLRAIGNDAFLFVPNLRPLIAAVNVYGRCPKKYVAELDKIYESDVAITHFPAGEVSRILKGKVQDSPWQKSFITKAIHNQRDVVPVFFEGKNSGLFYFIYRMRRFLFIKTNLELILLPREMFRKRNQKIRVVIGKPISWKQFGSSKTHHQWAQKVRDYVYCLGVKTDKASPPLFNDFLTACHSE
jgi:putative hemolysin